MHPTLKTASAIRTQLIAGDGRLAQPFAMRCLFYGNKGNREHTSQRYREKQQALDQHLGVH